jgi:hypothetical protein
MFEKIGWLHISDLHLKSQGAAWAQDVVLSALLKAILEQRASRATKGQFRISEGLLINCSIRHKGSENSARYRGSSVNQSSTRETAVLA